MVQKNKNVYKTRVHNYMQLLHEPILLPTTSIVKVLKDDDTDVCHMGPLAVSDMPHSGCPVVSDPMFISALTSRGRDHYESPEIQQSGLSQMSVHPRCLKPTSTTVDTSCVPAPLANPISIDCHLSDEPARIQSVLRPKVEPPKGGESGDAESQ